MLSVLLYTNIITFSDTGKLLVSAKPHAQPQSEEWRYCCDSPKMCDADMPTFFFCLPFGLVSDGFAGPLRWVALVEHGFLV